MSEQAEDTNPLAEIQEKIAEVIEILNQPYVPLIVPVESILVEGEPAGETPAT